MNRAQRRHRKRLAKQRAQFLAVRIWGYPRDSEVTVDMVNAADNLKRCGNECCRNVRRSGYRTAQGITAAEAFALDELNKFRGE